VYNTHWDHQSQPSREKAAVLILERIAARLHSDEPVIVMGDFNATTTNPAIKALLDSGDLVDHGGDKQKQTFNHWKPGLNEGLRIDHVFTSPSIKKGEIEVPAAGDPVASDHNPVILTISEI
jgi:endonuclease/exonuclease/phosphatase family metal-dependent hydrolase